MKFRVTVWLRFLSLSTAHVYNLWKTEKSPILYGLSRQKLSTTKQMQFRACATIVLARCVSALVQVVVAQVLEDQQTYGLSRVGKTTQQTIGV